MKIGCLYCCTTSQVDEPREVHGFYICPECGNNSACEIVDVAVTVVE
jgi:hypothetical protein